MHTYWRETGKLFVLAVLLFTGTSVTAAQNGLEHGSVQEEDIYRTETVQATADSPGLRETEALALLVEMEQAEQRWETRMAQLKADGLESIYPALREAYKLEQTGGAARGSAFWSLHQYMVNKEPSGGMVRTVVETYAHAAEPSRMQDDMMLLLALVDGIAPINANPSFEIGTTTAPPWKMWKTSKGTITRTTDAAQSGSASVMLNEVDWGGVLQHVDVRSGTIAAQASYYTPPAASTKGTIRLIVHFRDSNDTKLGEWSSEMVPLADSNGKWATIGMVGIIPKTISGKHVTRIWVLVETEGGEPLYVDDVEVYQQS